MQIISDISQRELKKDQNPLSLAYHPLSKIQFIGKVIGVECERGASGEELFDQYSHDDMYVMSRIIEDATTELKTLIRLAEKKH